LYEFTQPLARNGVSATHSFIYLLRLVLMNIQLWHDDAGMSAHMRTHTFTWLLIKPAQLKLMYGTSLMYHKVALPCVLINWAYMYMPIAAANSSSLNSCLCRHPTHLHGLKCGVLTWMQPDTLPLVAYMHMFVV
jgi:hypothetical protein